MASIYDLKPRFQALLRPLAGFLARAGVTANQVTIAAVLLSLATGAALLIWPWAMLLVPGALFVRMALNAIDGMLAREHGQKSRMGAVLNELGDEAAGYFEELLPRALESFENVILVTHVPPFREACWYDGKISNDDYLPHFSCKAVGEVLVRTMQRYPKRRLTVLCGHTHGAGVAQILDNLVVKTGGAEYGAPALQEVLLVG